MVHRWSQTLIPTARQVPAEAEVPSHQLMLRAGYIRKLGAGVYSYLPLGLRSLQKIMAIIRQEMDRAGAIEVFLPSLQPIELWERTGRRLAYGENLFVLKDRHQREQALGPTHEEVITELVGGYVQSYTQLPLTLYQIQTKFRDEFRPRFGVLRSREFQMKDAYSFHTKVDGPPGSGSLNETYDKQYAAYCRIFTRCGIPYRVVEAESGPIGGSASHEFMVPSPTGEDTILESDKGNYAANVEKCEIGPRNVSETLRAYAKPGFGSVPAAPPSGNLDKVHTPNCATIEDVGKFMKVKPKNMLKSLVYVATRTTDDADPAKAKDPWYVLAIVRGDHDVNEGKLRAIIAAQLGSPVNLALAPLDLAKQDGFVIGYVGPHAAAGRDDTYLVLDADVALDQFWASGANEADHHVKYLAWQRDVLDKLDATARQRVSVADIRNASDGDPSPKNDGGILRTKKGIEIGHVFKLGTKYTAALEVSVLDETNQRVPVIMGCYGIGVNRILAAAIERKDEKDARQNGHDENGIVLPAAIAPYAVLITPVLYKDAMKDTAEKFAAELEQLSVRRGDSDVAIDVLIDDRDERPGVKFKDADLIGLPIRITIGEKGLAEGTIEIKARNGSNGPKGEVVPLAAAAQRVRELLATL